MKMIPKTPSLPSQYSPKFTILLFSWGVKAIKKEGIPCYSSFFFPPFHNGFKNLYNAQCTYFQTVRYDASIALKSPIYPPFFYYIPIFTWLLCVVYGSVATHPTVASLSSRPHRYPPRPEDAQKKYLGHSPGI